MKHCILVKWNKEVKDKKEIAKKAKSVFAKLLEIDGIRRIQYRENCIEKSNRYDFLICIEMNKEVLPIYDASALHKEWKEKYGKFVENKAIFDFEE